MSERIQIARYANFRRAILGLKGPDALTVDSHVQPYLLVDDFTRPELRPQGDVNTWSRFVSVGLVAGQSAWAQITVPAPPPGTTGSGDRLYVIEGVGIRNVTLASEFRIGFATAEAGGAANAAFSRYGPFTAIPQGQLNMQTGTTIAVSHGSMANLQLAAGASVLVGPPLFPFMLSNEVIAGGGVFKVSGVTLANACDFTIFGYDRPMTPSEQ